MFFRVRGSEVVLDSSSCKLSCDYPYSCGFGVEAVMHGEHIEANWFP